MLPFPQAMQQNHAALQQGWIQTAYRGMMEYLMGLRSRFQARFPDDFVSGSLYFGYMDMTYFSVIPRSFKARGLKIAVVFVHDSFRFEVWARALTFDEQGQLFLQPVTSCAPTAASTCPS